MSEGQHIPYAASALPVPHARSVLVLREHSEPVVAPDVSVAASLVALATESIDRPAPSTPEKATTHQSRSSATTAKPRKRR